MTNPSGAVGIVLLLLCSLPLPGQKKVQLKAIRFQGAAQYSQQELLAAAGLKPDAPLNFNEVKARARQLNDTGFFKEIKFSCAQCDYRNAIDSDQLNYSTSCRFSPIRIPFTSTTLWLIKS